MVTITLGWGTAAALLAWSLLTFWLGRASTGRRRANDLSGLPPSLSMLAVAQPTDRDTASLAPETLAAIRSELARGDKIGAIKLMREATGLGLAEAKHAVEAMTK